MKIAMFSTKRYERAFFTRAASGSGHEFIFFEEQLKSITAGLAEGCAAVCAFVNDEVNRRTLEQLKTHGVTFIALRSAGFNHVDVRAAADLGISVARVPAYSPWAVAEHTIGLMLALNRKLHRAYARVREHNFSLDGLMGFDLHGKTAGIVGTGKIGALVAHILRGFGCKVLCFDKHVRAEIEAEGAQYVGLDDIWGQCHIVSLHCPLTPETYHMVDERAVAKMRPGVMLVNTSRGALVSTPAVIEGLKSGKIGSLALDVYEEEGDLFFKDLSGEILQDDLFSLLLTYPNVLITAHQAFFTEEALIRIAEITVENICGFCSGRIKAENVVDVSLIAAE